MGKPVAFDFTCNDAPQGVNFVYGPPVRGTLDILWSCLGVLLLSTWEISSIHKVSELTEDMNRKGVGAVISRFFTRSFYLILAMLMPEAITVYRFITFKRARDLYHRGKRFAEDNVEWTWAKAYFTVDEGFAVQFDLPPPSENAENDIPSDTGINYYGTESKDGSNEETRRLRSSDFEHGSSPHAREMGLNGEQLLYLREILVLKTLPEISSTELDDHNKSNALVQTLAFVQSFWLVVQLAARYTQNLAITQLETVTLAFAFISVTTRALDWHRPKEVHTTIKLRAARWLKPEELELLKTKKQIAVSNWILVAVILTGVVFGGLHCIAWNENFPSHIEQTLWRASAVITTALPVVGVATLVLLGAFDIQVDFMGWLHMAVYMLVRVFIIIETVRSLFYQPPSTFVATWTVNFPHLG